MLGAEAGGEGEAEWDALWVPGGGAMGLGEGCPWQGLAQTLCMGHSAPKGPQCPLPGKASPPPRSISGEASPPGGWFPTQQPHTFVLGLLVTRSYRINPGPGKGALAPFHREGNRGTDADEPKWL